MIREVTHRDVDTTLQAAEASGLFAPEEIPILRAQLERSLSGESDREEFWLADFDEAGTALGAAFCAEEPMTDRVWQRMQKSPRVPEVCRRSVPCIALNTGLSWAYAWDETDHSR